MREERKSLRNIKPNGWALLPFLVFAVFYVGLSVWANDFYKISMPVAFLVASASAMFFNRRKPQPGKTVFIDARQMGVMEDRTHKVITPEEIEKIAGTVHTFQRGEPVDEKGFAAVATTEEIAKQDYMLTPGRYVGIAEAKDDGEPISVKLPRLQKELAAMFEESHRLEAEIKKQLAGVKIREIPNADMLKNVIK